MKRHVAVLMVLLASACGGSVSTGSVTGVTLSDGKVLAVVKMDDGREVHAVMPETNGPTAFVGGQRVQLERMPNSSLWRVVRTLDAKKGAANADSSKPFNVAVTGKARQQQWTPPDGSPGIVIVRGAALKLVDGSMSGFEAQPGYDLVIVNLEIAINAADASLPLDKAVALDATGQEYANLGVPKPLVRGAGQRRQFGFAVPVGTELAKVRLSNGYTLDLAGK